MIAKLDAAEVQALCATAPGWTLSEDGRRVTASLAFADFAAAWGFMTRIAIEADKLDHHPEWSNVYNRVTISLTTHDANGLTARDVALAAKVARALDR
jgi:4a-hydroxytetrahydrobiopterin dehydratase